MVYKIFDKDTSGRAVKNENISKKKLAEELHKPIIKKFKKRKINTFAIFGVLILLICN